MFPRGQDLSGEPQLLQDFISGGKMIKLFPIRPCGSLYDQQNSATNWHKHIRNKQPRQSIHVIQQLENKNKLLQFYLFPPWYQVLYPSSHADFAKSSFIELDPQTFLFIIFLKIIFHYVAQIGLKF